MRKIYLTLFSFLSFGWAAWAQDNSILDSAAIYNMTLEQLMNIKSSGVSSELESLINSLIGVASKKPMSSRKSPSIVTLITQEEIEKSGARDLIDVLSLVPGINFASDVAGVVGIGMRGNWANEGKVLVLLDGQEMNEIMYSTLQFGNHFDVSQIKRIEVIRGPGSAIYGGYAEYGVISIITKSGEDLNGISANVSYGQMTKSYGERDVTVSAGKKIGDFMFSLAGFIGQGQRSDLTYNDFVGNHYPMNGNSALNPGTINLGMSYKDWSLRAIYDDYQTTTRDNYGTALSQAYPDDFKSGYFELKYKGKINDKLTITPKFNYLAQLPWNFAAAPAPQDAAYTTYNELAQRTKGNITLSYDATSKINIIAGVEAFTDKATILGLDTTHFDNGSRTISYFNSAAFFQALVKSKIAYLTVGARFDNNSSYGSSFVPRLGITKKIEKWNFKLLYSEAFRAPGIDDINYSLPPGTIKPETTQTIELETGYQPGANSYITVNLFDITTFNPIIYSVDTVVINKVAYSGDAYTNQKQSGSIGIETDYRIRSTWGYLDFNYAYYTTAGKDDVPVYQVPANTNMTLAFPANKFNLSANFNLGKSFSIAPTASLLGRRYGYDPSEPASENYLKEYPPLLLANIFITWNNCITKGLKIGLGCYNMLNSEDLYIQPYNGGHPPLPGPTREFVARITYNLNAKK